MAPSRQIAIRIPEADLEALDQVIADGRFENRADAMKEALKRLLTEDREAEIEASYRKAYTEHPQEESEIEMHTALAVETFKRLDAEEAEE